MVNKLYRTNIKNGVQVHAIFYLVQINRPYLRANCISRHSQHIIFNGKILQYLRHIAAAISLFRLRF